MTKREEYFISDLADLLDKYNAKVFEKDIKVGYNGETSTEYWFGNREENADALVIDMEDIDSELEKRKWEKYNEENH